MGKWPYWDPRIPPKGSFIEGWLGGSLVETIIGNVEKFVHERIRLWVWDKFCRVAPLFYPHPLIAEP